MQNIVGVVAEYNPFHNGHVYHLEQTRAKVGGDCGVVAVLSGDFVQRGENAIYSKFARAEAAVRCGCDLVLELPLPWSLASAEGFARGAVGLLAVLVRQEILLVIVGGVFVMEIVSVIIQVASVRLTGSRVFICTPIHHHFERKGWTETQIVVRFWILAGVFALAALATLKLR